jgi:hypothetical protein
MLPTEAGDLAHAWTEGETFDRFFARIASQRELWEGVYRTARIPEWGITAFGGVAPLRLLVLNADWCLDSASTVPVMARLAETVPGVELRLLERDDHLALMDRYLTNGARSIPLAILMDGACRELGRWGPRPAELQAWVLAHRDSLPAAERYREQRRWYARDRGETTLREILAALRRD